MKAIAYRQAHTLDALNDQPELALADVTLPQPTITDDDLLVAVKAIALNPVDTKVRKGMSGENNDYKVLGWDAAGVVEAVGANVEGFKVGDKVWYAGDITRQGSNAEFQAVDARIASLMPNSLSFADAAALPLTAITAWELIFDRLELNPTAQTSILIVGAAGGVGSIMVQLLNKLTDAKVIATASREASKNWLQELGADVVLDHSKPLSEELARHQLPLVDAVASLNNTEEHFAELVKCLKPQGKFSLIDDPEQLDISALKRKSLSLHWEFMFTRPVFKTDDLIRQQHILQQVAALIEEGKITSTASQHLGAITAENILKAHHLIESQTTCGKIVMEGFI